MTVLVLDDQPAGGGQVYRHVMQNDAAEKKADFLEVIIGQAISLQMSSRDHLQAYGLKAASGKLPKSERFFSARKAKRIEPKLALFLSQLALWNARCRLPVGPCPV